MPPLTGPVGEGKALPIAKARARVNEFDESRTVASGDTSAVFRLPLKAGEAQLQTWLYDAAGNELCGVFYVTVHRQ